ncbi:MAG TPA: hypothetical protein VK168_02190 [Saprospiraceae bacterium]|nr:hypothetical protein [Saprospiraceae bacterium]
MRPIFFLLLCLLLHAGAHAQTLLQDAEALREYFDQPDASDFDQRLIFNWDALDARHSEIMRKYCITKDTLTTYWVEESFRDNVFLLVERTDQNRVLLAGFAGEDRVESSKTGVSASGFSVSTLADGLARFLVKRTKQELSLAFFDEFKETVRNDRYVGHFCPFTQAQLLRIDSDVYQFNDYLESLREGFTADMTSLPMSLETFVRDESFCQGCTQKEAGIVLADMFHIAQQMVNGESPVDMISYLADPSYAAIQSTPETMPVLYNMAGGLRFLNLMSESFRNPNSMDPKMPWYTSKEIREKLKDPVLLRIYLGLLWQKAGDIQFLDDSGAQKTNLRLLMGQANTGGNLVANWRRSIESMADLTQATQFSLRSSSGTDGTTADDFFAYAQSVTDILQNINQMGKTMLGRQKDIIPTDYIFLMRHCNSLYFNVRQRNFAGAVSNVIYCLNLIGSDKEKIATLLKYANFMAAVAEANTPDEMERAIEAFALPPGSSRMKKQPGQFAVALNAYTGLAGGWEVLDGASKVQNFGSVAAPVGLSLSWGLGKRHPETKVDTLKSGKIKIKVREYGSLGLFVPIIDVGAVTAYRFKDDSAQNLPELTWSNILSPGLYLTYHLPRKWPIALGVGGQLGPGLRKVTENGLEVDRSGYRYGAFVAVDIPITYFYLNNRFKK